MIFFDLAILIYNIHYRCIIYLYSRLPMRSWRYAAFSVDNFPTRMPPDLESSFGKLWLIGMLIPTLPYVLSLLPSHCIVLYCIV